jgi:hypothetical protein
MLIQDIRKAMVKREDRTIDEESCLNETILAHRLLFKLNIKKFQNQTTWEKMSFRYLSC